MNVKIKARVGEKESANDRIVAARNPRGCRDLLPMDLIARDDLIHRICRVFELFGFDHLSTPALEHLDVLGRDHLENEQEASTGNTYKVVHPDRGGEHYGLRFDLTVPLARVIAQHGNHLPLPVRRYQHGPVWRVDKPGPGRFREFVQLDLDVVGETHVDTDAEILHCIVHTMHHLRSPAFRVRLNHRRLLEGVLNVACVPHDEHHAADHTSTRKKVLRSLDKLDRLGLEGILKLLGEGRKDPSGDFTEGAHLSPQSIEVLHRFLEIGGDTQDHVLDHMQILFGADEAARAGIDDLREICHTLEVLGVPEELVQIDPTVIRGLDYYTGAIFETVLLDKPEIGSVFSGGRYDGLFRRFLGHDLPAVGASVGVDRLLEALKGLGRIESRASATEVLVTNLGHTHRHAYHRITSLLRNAGIKTRLYMGETPLKHQLKYANRLGIPLAVIAGEKELEHGHVSVKDLHTGAQIAKGVHDSDAWKDYPTQVTIHRGELVEHVREVLAAKHSGHADHSNEH